MYTRSKLNKTVTWILLAIALIFILSPFYFIVVNSFKPLSEIAADGFALPKHFSLDNYTTAWTRLKFAARCSTLRRLPFCQPLARSFSAPWQATGLLVIITSSRSLSICL